MPDNLILVFFRGGFSKRFFLVAKLTLCAVKQALDIGYMQQPYENAEGNSNYMHLIESGFADKGGNDGEYNSEDGA